MGSTLAQALAVEGFGTVLRLRRDRARVVLPPAVHRPGAQTAVIADPEGNHWERLWEG